jgi:hypothetical protein
MQNKELIINDINYKVEYYNNFNVNLEIIEIINTLIESIKTTRARNESFFLFMRDVSFSKLQLNIKTQLLEDIFKCIINQKFSRKEFNALPGGKRNKSIDQDYLASHSKEIMQSIEHAIDLSIEIHYDKVFPKGAFNPDAINKLSWQGLPPNFSRSEFERWLQNGAVGTDTHLLFFKLKVDFQKYQENVISKPMSYHAQNWPIYEISATKAQRVQSQQASDVQASNGRLSFFNSFSLSSLLGVSDSSHYDARSSTLGR